MMAISEISVSVDLAARAGYITLSCEQVESTVEYSDDILVDLDALGVVVGIEVLNLGADLPIGDLTQRFHIRSELSEAVKLLRPSLGSQLSFSTSAGISSRQSEHTLEPQCDVHGRTPEFS